MRPVVSGNEIAEILAFDLDINEALLSLLDGGLQGEQVEAWFAGGGCAEGLLGHMAAERALLQKKVSCRPLHIGEGLWVDLLFPVKFGKKRGQIFA